MEYDFIPPSDDIPLPNSDKWPLLLKGYDNMIIRTNLFTPLPCGQSPNKRSIPELLKYGIILLDKPSNVSSHEISAFIRKLYKINRLSHSVNSEKR